MKCGQGECRETQRDASRSCDCMSMHVHCMSHLASELKFGELMRSAIEPALFTMKFEDLPMRACGPFTDKRRPPRAVLLLVYSVPTEEIQAKSIQIRCTRGNQREATGKELRKCRHLDTNLACLPGRHRRRTITITRLGM